MTSALLFLSAALIGAGTMLGLWCRSVRDMAHEVRRPMTALLLASESCRDHLSEHELKAIQDQVIRASDLLDSADPVAAFISKRSGHPQKARLPLPDLVESVAAAWGPAARLLGRRIMFEGSSSRMRLVEAVALDRGLGNLVANALEHGAGDVVIQSANGSNGETLLEVRNLGQGCALKQWTGGRRGRGQRIAAAQARQAGWGLSRWSEASGKARIEIRGEGMWG